MKIPYGESNFKTVISGGYVYVDKTATINQLEEAGKYLFLLRPRRFGKSLFLSMLEYYYDVAYRTVLTGHGQRRLCAQLLRNAQNRYTTRYIGSAIRHWRYAHYAG